MHKYLRFKNYKQYALLLANRYAAGHVESLMGADPDLPLLHPPIFFLGAPRSGSTLAFQVITDALDVGYISNAHGKLYGAPALYERLYRPTANRPQSNYQSDHGQTQGGFAPSECGEWWYRFFRRTPAYVTLGDVDPRKMRAFRLSVAALTIAFNRPIVFKNLYASLRIQAIARYLPESLFVVTHRNEIDNGHSLLETRLKVFDDYHKWWSMEPPYVNELKRQPAHKQVIQQIRHIHRIIEKDLLVSGVSDNRVFDLNYENFCDDPAGVIESMHKFLEANGCTISRRKVDIPMRFPRRKAIRIDRALYAKMVSYAQEH